MTRPARLPLDASARPRPRGPDIYVESRVERDLRRAQAARAHAQPRTYPPSTGEPLRRCPNRWCLSWLPWACQACPEC